MLWSNFNPSSHINAVFISLQCTLNQLTNTLSDTREDLSKCDFNDTNVCGWRDARSGASMYEDLSRDVSRWTRVKIGVGRMCIKYISCNIHTGFFVLCFIHRNGKVARITALVVTGDAFKFASATPVTTGAVILTTFSFQWLWIYCLFLWVPVAHLHTFGTFIVTTHNILKKFCSFTWPKTIYKCSTSHIKIFTGIFRVLFMWLCYHISVDWCNYHLNSIYHYYCNLPVCFTDPVVMTKSPQCHRGARTCFLWENISIRLTSSQIAKFMGPTWGPPGSCRPQMGPMLAPWTLLSGIRAPWRLKSHGTQTSFLQRLFFCPITKETYNSCITCLRFPGDPCMTSSWCSYFQPLHFTCLLLVPPPTIHSRG